MSLTSLTNLFKPAERVQVEIPSEGLDWNDFKGYFEGKFPRYRIRLQEVDKEGDKIRKDGYYIYVARIPRALSLDELVEIEKLRRRVREEHLPPKHDGGIRAIQTPLSVTPTAFSR